MADPNTPPPEDDLDFDLDFELGDLDDDEFVAEGAADPGETTVAKGDDILSRDLDTLLEEGEDAPSAAAEPIDDGVPDIPEPEPAPEPQPDTEPEPPGEPELDDEEGNEELDPEPESVPESEEGNEDGDGDELEEQPGEAEDDELQIDEEEDAPEPDEDRRPESEPEVGEPEPEQDEVPEPGIGDGGELSPAMLAARKRRVRARRTESTGEDEFDVVFDDDGDEPAVSTDADQPEAQQADDEVEPIREAETPAAEDAEDGHDLVSDLDSLTARLRAGFQSSVAEPGAGGQEQASADSAESELAPRPAAAAESDDLGEIDDDLEAITAELESDEEEPSAAPDENAKPTVPEADRDREVATAAEPESLDDGFEVIEDELGEIDDLEDDGFDRGEIEDRPSPTVSAPGEDEDELDIELADDEIEDDPDDEIELSVGSVDDDRAEADDDSQDIAADLDSAEDTGPDDAPAAAGAAQTKLLELKPLELVGVAAVGVACLVGLAMLTSSVGSIMRESKSLAPSIEESPPGKISGQHVQIGSLECFWRDRTASDRVDEKSRILPVVELGAPGGAGMVQILFLDQSSEIRGDAHTFEVSGGSFMGSGSSATALGTEGLTNEVRYAHYRSRSEHAKRDRWSVTVRESADGKSWEDLVSFEIPALRRSAEGE